MTRRLVVAAPDSFKGSCSASEAAREMLAGVRDVWGDSADYAAVPLADGGEGTLDALLGAWGVAARDVPVHDAIGRPRTARFGLSADGRMAIIEAAEANGLPWVSDVPLRPLDADTAGVGELALAALDAGASDLIVCVGGSATSDGGTGLLRALGARFHDASGAEVAAGARGLGDIARVDASGIDVRALSARWRIAVDVTYPLTGPTGASAVFGPQKGANSDDVEVIDAGLQQLATVLAEARGMPTSNYTERAGFGAAGGLPLSVVALLGAELVPGAELVSDAIGLREKLARATLVLTGEGKLDAQSLNGKVVDLALRTRPPGVPLVVIAGSVDLTETECRDAGIAAACSIAQGPETRDELIARTPSRIRETAAQVAALIESRESK